MLEIRIAKENEYEPIKAFYHSLIDAMQDSERKPGWTDFKLYEYRIS